MNCGGPLRQRRVNDVGGLLFRKKSAGWRMIPKKPALGLDPRVGIGFRKRSCASKMSGKRNDSI
jgi:hypothetical protein